MVVSCSIATCCPRSNNVEYIDRVSPKSGDPGPVYINGSPGPTSPHPKRHLDQSGRGRGQHIHRLADYGTLVTIGRILFCAVLLIILALGLNMPVSAFSVHSNFHDACSTIRLSLGQAATPYMYRVWEMLVWVRAPAVLYGRLRRVDWVGLVIRAHYSLLLL